MFGRIRSLVVKELYAVLLDPKTRFQVFVGPFIMLFLFSFAITMEVRNAPLAVLNQDNGDLGRRLEAAFTASPAFTHAFSLSSVLEVEPAIAEQRALMVLRIPEGFSASLMRGEPVSVQVILDGRKANAVQIAYGYAVSITSGFARGLRKTLTGADALLSVEPRQLFNPNHDYLWFTLPVLLVVLTQMLSLLVSGMSVARERELGTFEQLLVSPLSPLEIVAGKALPAAAIALGIGVAIHVLARTVFGVPCLGSLGLLALSFLLFILASTGVGLLISSLCNTQQQAFLGVFTCMVPFVLLSGFATPIENMPHALQTLTLLNPARHIIVIALGVYLKDIPLREVTVQLLWLCGIAATTLGAAGWFFKRRIQ